MGMIKKTVRVLMIALLVSTMYVTLGIAAAVAQDENEPTGYANVHLWVYPEHDHPQEVDFLDDPLLLVMLEGRIVGVEPPALVKFLVPAGAVMYSAGSMDSQGQYTGGPPARKPSSVPGWDEISYTATAETFRVEYYDPDIIIGQPDKSISYEFRWVYPISNLDVVVQQPLSSSDFRVNPAGEAFNDTHGFTNYSYNFPELDDGPPLSFEISYTKSDTRPSISIGGDQAPGGGSQPSNGWLVGVIVAVVIAVISGVFFWTRKPRLNTRADRRRYSAAKRKNAPAGSQAGARFCTQCGAPLGGSDKFCPRCGARRR